MVDEVSKAQNLDKTESETIFHKIIKGTIPSTKVYEDTDLFRDIHCTNSHNNNTKSNEWFKYVILSKKRTY